MSFHSASTLLMLALAITSAIVYCFSRGKGVLVFAVLSIPPAVVAVLWVTNVGEPGWIFLLGSFVAFMMGVAAGWGAFIGSFLVHGKLWWALLLLAPMVYLPFSQRP